MEAFQLTPETSLVVMRVIMHFVAIVCAGFCVSFGRSAGFVNHQHLSGFASKSKNRRASDNAGNMFVVTVCVILLTAVIR